MIYREVSWIRSHSEKLCVRLRSAALEWFRPFKHIPCFLQKPLLYARQRMRKIPVIVQLEETPFKVFSACDIAASAGCRMQRELTLINSFSARVNAKQLETLTQNRHVRKIWYDREVKAVLDVASPAVQAPPLWEAGLTGRGIVVAVIDTGVYDHPDLSGRIVAFKDLVNHKAKPYDDNGHGTHVAGDIASNGSQSGSRYRGPAFEAGLVGVKVLDSEGSGRLSGVIEGVQWCVDNRERLGIRVLNMSLGSTAEESYLSDPACQAVEKAWRSGLVVCVAAGNEGPQAGSISSPGIDPLVITVGALDDSNTIYPGDDKVAYFSSRGPTVDGLVKPDLIAPGVNIVSLRAPNSTMGRLSKKQKNDSWYTSLSGTSMATPICSGVVAQMLQHDGSLTPDQVKARLMKTARNLGSLDSNIQGAGVIDAGRAVYFEGEGERA